jgi:hypothetical protein
MRAASFESSSEEIDDDAAVEALSFLPVAFLMWILSESTVL